ncbi:MAG: acetate/propionate family kinase [Acidimicrobiia bacterium]
MNGSPRATVVCINTGSSSLKAAVANDAGVTDRYEFELHAPTDLPAAVEQAIDQLVGTTEPPDAIGHRVVHGGAGFTGPTAITGAVLDELRALIPLAPLHQPAALATIEEMTHRMPGVPQVACFDTAFHRRLPESAQRLPLPERYWTAGIRRYGFHGLSYEYVVGRLGARLGARSVIAHLGGGSSLVALRDGVPVDTTMSLTPGGGLTMATRSGDLDPGVVLALLRLDGDPDRVADVLERESGLAGISGGTGDMRTLLDAAGTNPRAQEAVDTFALSAAKHIAAATSVLGGLDTLVFTGGIGAGSAAIRHAIAQRLSHLGVVVDDEANTRSSVAISSTDAGCDVLVVATDEEAVIATQTFSVIRRRP